jgi:hypothetical protein
LNSFQTDKYLFSAVLINFIYLFIIWDMGFSLQWL